MRRRVFVAAACAAALLGIVEVPAKAAATRLGVDVNCGHNQTATAYFKAGSNTIWEIWETTSTGEDSAKNAHPVERGVKQKVWVQATPTWAVKTIWVYDPTGKVTFTGTKSCSGGEAADSGSQTAPLGPGVPARGAPCYSEYDGTDGCTTFTGQDHVGNFGTLPGDAQEGINGAVQDPPPVP